VSHACPAGCGRDVPSDWYACPRDWHRLPAPIRSAVGRGYRTGDGHVEAMLAARRWYEEHPLPSPTTPGGTA
jgi:hypothetical protein